MTARNPYFTTVSGREIDLVAPSPADVSFEDVAHHLAHTTRYGGACKFTFTVAHHLLLGLQLCSEHAKPYWLAHDAHEYCGGDDPTPKKKARPQHLFAELKELFPLAQVELVMDAMQRADERFESTLMQAVHLAAGLQWPVPDAIAREVKVVDRVMLLTEWAVLMPGRPPEQYLMLDGQPVTPCKVLDIRERDFEWLKREFYAACVNHLPVYAHMRRR